MKEWRRNPDKIVTFVRNLSFAVQFGRPVTFRLIFKGENGHSRDTQLGI